MAKIKLNNNKYAIVDDFNFESLNKWKWTCDSNGYAVRHELKSEYGNNKRKMVKMHKFIMNTPIGKLTDHINQNRLDNRVENLRVVDNHINQRNSKLGASNTSGYKGVYWDSKYKKWCARITVYGKRIFGGGFLTPIEANNAYQNLVQNYG